MTLPIFAFFVALSIFALMDEKNQGSPSSGDKPIFFSRPLEGERFDTWVERLIEALDDQGVFGSDSKGGTKNGSDNR